MKVTPLKTPIITVGGVSLFEVLDQALPSELPGGSVIAVTSKVVSICEGNVVPVEQADREELIVLGTLLLYKTRKKKKSSDDQHKED